MSLRDGFRICIVATNLQWVEVMLIVLFPDFSGELNSKIIDIVYVSFTNFISVAYLVMRSRMSVLFGLGLMRESLPVLTSSSLESSSDGYMV